MATIQNVALNPSQNTTINPDAPQNDTSSQNTATNPDTSQSDTTSPNNPPNVNINKVYIALFIVIFVILIGLVIALIGIVVTINGSNSSTTGFVTIDGKQTLLNKTLTTPSIQQPTINTPDITNGLIISSGILDGSKISTGYLNNTLINNVYLDGVINNLDSITSLPTPFSQPIVTPGLMFNQKVQYSTTFNQTLPITSSSGIINVNNTGIPTGGSFIITCTSSSLITASSLIFTQLNAAIGNPFNLSLSILNILGGSFQIKCYNAGSGDFPSAAILLIMYFIC